MAKATPNIRKKEEFLAFMETIKGSGIPHWIDVAKAIGVNKDTITEWKKLPEAQNAIKAGISNSLRRMQEAGKNDWRMWESKLKMLGVSPKEKKDITSDDKPLPVPIYGGRSVDNIIKL